MSGLIGSATGINLVGNFQGFLDLLQNASFRGIPFKVETHETTKGRKLADHEYPFRDGGQPEDLGRRARIYNLAGYIVGDLAPAMQLALDTAAETAGPGLLIHPMIGAVQVMCLACSTSVAKEEGRVIRVRWVFKEWAPQSLTATLIATSIQVITNAASAILGIGASLGVAAGPAAASGTAAVAEGVASTTAFGNAVNAAAGDPGALVSMAAGLPPPDNAHFYGRYADGSTTTPLPVGTTVASLQAQLAAQRGVVAAAALNAQDAADQISTANAGAVAAALASLTEAARAAMTDPATQVRKMLNLAEFVFTDAAGGFGLGADMATVRDAVSAAARRCALASLAQACASYQPSSYQDAANLRQIVGDAFDVEILAAANAYQDDAYTALRQLRASVILDLTTRGARLPSVVTVTVPAPMPSLVLAYRLYGDATRADQLANAAGAVHPAFLPTSFQALAA